MVLIMGNAKNFVYYGRLNNLAFYLLERYLESLNHYLQLGKLDTHWQNEEGNNWIYRFSLLTQPIITPGCMHNIVWD